MSLEPLIRLLAVTKRFGVVAAVESLSLDIAPGEFFALLGPFRMQRELGTTFILVTHDQDEAMVMAQRIAVMREGRIEQIGTPVTSTFLR